MSDKIRIGSCLEVNAGKVEEFLELQRQKKFSFDVVSQRADWAYVSARTGASSLKAPSWFNRLAKMVFNARGLQNHEDEYIRWLGNMFTTTKAGMEDINLKMVDSIPMVQDRLARHYEVRVDAAYEALKRKFNGTEQEMNQQIADQLFNPNPKITNDPNNPIQQYLEVLEKANNDILDDLVAADVVDAEYVKKIRAKAAEDKANGFSYIYLPRSWDNRVNQIRMQELGMTTNDLETLINKAITEKQGQFDEAYRSEMADLPEDQRMPYLQWSYKQSIVNNNKRNKEIADRYRDKGDIKAAEHFESKIIPEDKMDELSKKLADEVVTGYQKRLTNPTDDFGNSYMAGQFDNQGLLEDIITSIKGTKGKLGLGDIDDDIFDGIVESLNANKIPIIQRSSSDRHASSKISNFKNRIDLNYNAEITLENGKTIRMSDFYNQEVHGLLRFYYRSMAGRVALGRNGIDTKYAGSNFENLISGIRERAGSDKDYTDEINILQEVYDIITGNTQLKQMSATGQSMNILSGRMRAWAHLTMLGQAGMSATAEIGMVAMEHGLHNFIRNFGKGLSARLSKGSLNPEDMEGMQELVYFVGLGNELDSPMMARVFDAHEDVLFGRNSKWDRAESKAKWYLHRMSGLTHVTHFTRRISMWNFAENLHRKGKSGLKQVLKSQIGLDDVDIDEIVDAINKFATFDGKRVIKFNLHKWVDTNAGKKFIEAITAHTHQMILEPSPAALRGWSNTPFGRMVMSIQSFLSATFNGAHAWSRRLGHGDPGAWTSLLGAGVMGFLIYMAKSWQSAQGGSEERKKAYLKDRYSPGAMVVGALSYVGPLAPAFYLFERVNRPESLEIGVIPPLFSAVFRGTGAVINTPWDMLSEEQKTNETQIRNMIKMIPFSNAYGFSMFTNWLAHQGAKQVWW